MERFEESEKLRQEVEAMVRRPVPLPPRRDSKLAKETLAALRRERARRAHQVRQHDDDARRASKRYTKPRGK